MHSFAYYLQVGKRLLGQRFYSLYYRQWILNTDFKSSPKVLGGKELEIVFDQVFWVLLCSEW